MDAINTKAGGGGQPAFQCDNARSNPTPSPREPQSRTAAIYAGTVLREARNIVERVHKLGPLPGIKAASQRLREALDCLDWLCEYHEHEGRR